MTKEYHTLRQELNEFSFIPKMFQGVSKGGVASSLIRGAAAGIGSLAKTAAKGVAGKAGLDTTAISNAVGAGKGAAGDRADMEKNWTKKLENCKTGALDFQRSLSSANASIDYAKRLGDRNGTPPDKNDRLNSALEYKKSIELDMAKFKEECAAIEKNKNNPTKGEEQLAKTEYTWARRKEKEKSED